MPFAGRLSFAQPFVQDPALAAGLLRLHRMLEQSATSLELESSLLDLLIQLTQRCGHAHAEAPAPGKEPARISRVRDYIHEHYWQDVTLARLAEIADFSQFHLLRTFRKIVGLTPHAYLIQTRVEAAKEMLRSGLALATVAVSAGFVDQSHFNRHFKRIVGATPGQYHPELRARG